MSVYALTIRQPHVGWIISGEKQAEYRTWRTKYRGELALHSGRTADPGTAPTAVLGAIVGVCILVDCRLLDDQETWAWALEHVRALREPVAWRGRQGLWPVPDGVARAMRDQPR